MSKKVDYYKLGRTGIRGNTKTHWEKSQGILWKYEGFEVYLEKVDGSYRITEGTTGLIVNSDIWKHLPSIEKAKEDFKQTVQKIGVEELRKKLEGSIEKHGFSPLYGEQFKDEKPFSYWDYKNYVNNMRRYG